MALDIIKEFPNGLAQLLYTSNTGTGWSRIPIPGSIMGSAPQAASFFSEDFIACLVLSSTNDCGIMRLNSDGSVLDTIRPPVVSIPGGIFYYDAMTMSIVGGTGLEGTGFSKLSTDGGKTWRGLFDQSGLNYVISEYYTPSLGYYRLSYGDPDFITWTDLGLFNAATKSVRIVPDCDFGALYKSGAYIAYSFWHRLFLNGKDSTYQVDLYNGQGIRFHSLATTDEQHAWILSDSGRCFRRIDLITSVGKPLDRQERSVPNDIQIGTYPNPFNGLIKLQFKTTFKMSDVELSIFDLLGRRQRVLYSGDLDSGTNEFLWDGRNDQRREVASGIYFAVMSGPVCLLAKKLLFIK
jgi:hypothetical protein